MKSNQAKGTREPVTEENLSNELYASNKISEKLLKLIAKDAALEDCQHALKKVYEKDQIDLTEFLSNIRKLAGSQFMVTVKRSRIEKGL
jgi:hypothetical protein